MSFFALSIAVASTGMAMAEVGELGGTYEFEIMGAPYRLYVCGPSDDPADGVYWSVAKLNEDHTNEYTMVVGRDKDGIESDGESGASSISCAVFRLYGDRHLQGYYRLEYRPGSGGEGDSDSWTLFERYPELEDGQTGAEAEELWNHYELNKVSGSIVGNPRLFGYHVHPKEYAHFFVPFPSVWASGPSSRSDRFSDVMAMDGLTGSESNCWRYVDVFGNTHLFGNLYGPRREWDGSLLLSRWDDYTNPDHCYVGSQMVVMLEPDLLLMSYQCEDGVTGRQMLMRLQEGAEVECPVEVPEHFAELTQRELSRSNLDK